MANCFLILQCMLSNFIIMKIKLKIYRSAEVGTGKSVHRTVGIVVASTAVPPLIASVWTQLHHSKRRLCTRVRMAVAAGSDKWVDIFNRSPLCILRRKL